MFHSPGVRVLVTCLGAIARTPRPFARLRGELHCAIYSPGVAKWPCGCSSGAFPSVWSVWASPGEKQRKKKGRLRPSGAWDVGWEALPSAARGRCSTTTLEPPGVHRTPLQDTPQKLSHNSSSYTPGCSASNFTKLVPCSHSYACSNPTKLTLPP